MASNPLNIDAAKGSLFGKILMFSLSLAAIYLLEFFFDTASLVVAGRFCSPRSFAAIGSTADIINLLRIPVAGLGCGALVMAARCRGAGDDGGVSRIVRTLPVLAFVLGLVLMALGAVLARPLLMWMRVPYDYINQTTSYLRLSAFALPSWAVVTVGIMLMYGLGDTLLPFLIQLISGLVRVGSSFVFMRFFRMEVEGLAIAPLISQTLAAALLMLILNVLDAPERIKWSGIRVHARELGLIAAIGVPVMILSAALSLTNDLVTSQINGFGVSAVVGNSAARILTGLMSGLFVLPMYNAAMVFAGQNGGAGKYDRVLKGTLICALLATVMLVLSGAAGLIFGERLLGFIRRDPAVIDQAMLRLYVTLPVFFLCGLMNVFAGALIGLGKWWAAVASAAALVGRCVFVIIWVFAVLPHFRSLGVLMAFWPVSWGIVALVNGAMFFVAVFLSTRTKVFPGKSVDDRGPSAP